MQKTSILPKLSIIIPIFNNSREDISRCLSHIDKKQYENIEVIIIDDGSSDSCKRMLNELSAQFSFCQVIHQDNQGVSAARNKGISMATGDFITFIDGDDIFSENFFIDLKEIFLKHSSTNIDVIYGYIRRVYDIPDSQLEISQITHTNIRSVSALDKMKLMYGFIQDHISDFRNESGYLGCVSPGRVVKASIIKKIKFNENLSHNEDNIWNLELLKNINRAIIVDRCWYYYIYNPNSATHTFNLDIVHAYENYLNHLWDHYIDDTAKSICYLRLTIHLALSLKAKNYKGKANLRFKINELFKHSPWRNEINWDYFFSLNKKDKIFFILIKFGLIDFIYQFKLFIKYKLKFRMSGVRNSDWL